MGITKAMRRAVLGAATIGALAVPASAFGAATLTIANGDAALTATTGDIDTITVTSSPSDVKLSARDKTPDDVRGGAGRDTATVDRKGDTVAGDVERIRRR